MLYERVAWIVAVAVVGGAAFFGGQQLGLRNGLDSRAQAAQQFFGERGGGQGAGNSQRGNGAPGAANNAAGNGAPGAANNASGAAGGANNTAGGGAPGAGGQRGGGQNVAGVVESVSGSTLVLKTPDGTKTTVTLAADGTVRKQEVGQIGDIKAGDQVVAFGERQGEAFSARVLQIGGGRVTQ